jgi:hypothetical protein
VRDRVFGDPDRGQFLNWLQLEGDSWPIGKIPENPS